MSDETVAKQICEVEGQGVLDGKRASGAPGEQVGAGRAARLCRGSAPAARGCALDAALCKPPSGFDKIILLFYLLLINRMLPGKKF